MALAVVLTTVPWYLPTNHSDPLTTGSRTCIPSRTDSNNRVAGAGESPAAVAGTAAPQSLVAVPQPPGRRAVKDGRGRRAVEAGGAVRAGSGLWAVSGARVPWRRVAARPGWDTGLGPDASSPMPRWMSAGIEEPSRGRGAERIDFSVLAGRLPLLPAGERRAVAICTFGLEVGKA